MSNQTESDKQMTPMMEQYQLVKQDYPDTLLFYRIGDFYEMFFDDALTASRELQLTLTGRDCGKGKRAPMCGVPHHACESYIARLVKKGYKVAICEQMEDPATAVGLVRRDIIRVVTPGTVLEGSMLEEKRNNYIASLYYEERGCAICVTDISTGAFYATAAEGRDCTQRMRDEIARYEPREVLQNFAASRDAELQSILICRFELKPETLPEAEYDYETDRLRVREQFGEKLGDEGGCDPRIVCAAGALLRYLDGTQRTALSQINQMQIYQKEQYLMLDADARRNLELSATLRGRQHRGTLLNVLDRTCTAMGGRLLTYWLENPLTGPAAILRRQDAVEEAFRDPVWRSETRELLDEIYDIERLASRIAAGTTNARDLLSLRGALRILPELKERLLGRRASLWRELGGEIDLQEPLCELIGRAISEDPLPPVTLHEGGIIRDGFDPEVDRLREILGGGKDLLAEIEAREREATGIRNLKVTYNKVFGYFIEVSKSFLDKVPASYVRKQTLTNCERFITQELKNLENDVFSARNRINEREFELYEQVRGAAAAQVTALQKTAEAVATADVLCSFAEVAAANNYVRPEIDLSDTLSIVGGRHPVVEQVQVGVRFVPNDALLDCRENRVAVITGPNMAGKSTYMRQIALIVILAQMGSFVPATSARIGVVDRIFTRIGASDDVAAGQSTFMVEMVEVANILREATSHSLIILDEIGRGTSTFDGMSIARAVLEYVADKKRIGAKTVFATHYHELTALEELVDGVKNYNISVKKRGDNITFLRKIVRGGADESYGIEVAKLAGIPNPVISRAKEILAELDAGKSVLAAPRARAEEGMQTGLVSLGAGEIVEQLARLETDTLTPIEALNLLYELAGKAKKA